MKFLIFFFLLLANIFCKAQNSNVEIIINKDSIENEYKESVRHKLQTKFDINTDTKSITFQKDKDAKELILAPNLSTNLRLSLNYKFLGIAYSISPNFLPGNNDDKEKGESTTTEFVLNINLKKFQQRLVYNQTVGYYVLNTSDFPILGGNTSYIKLPNFKTTYIGSETYFFLNPYKYSYKLARTQNEIQKKSAGSIIIPLSLNYTRIDENITDTNQQPLRNINYPRKSADLNIFTGLGYGYNLVKNEFYISGLLVPMFGYDRNEITKKNEEIIVTNSLAIAINNEISAGYNSKTWFGGIFANYSTWEIVNDKKFYEESNFYVSMFIGYRFKAPKFLTKIF